MKRSLLFPFLAAVSVLAAVPFAQAGYKTAEKVSIWDSTRTASGMLGAVRDSDDALQYIGCTLYATATQISGYCAVRNEHNLMRSCSTTAAPQLQAIAGMTSGSKITFTWGSDGKCEKIWVNNDSFNAQLAP